MPHKNPHLLAQISTALTALQLVVGVAVFGSGDIRVLRLAGFLIWGVAVFLTLWPIRILRTHGGVPDGASYVHTATLVDRGLYAIVRHPQYLGWMLINLALMLVTQQWIIVALGLVAMGSTFRYSQIAEGYAVAKFGDDYRRYVQRVPRFNALAGIVRLLRR